MLISVDCVGGNHNVRNKPTNKRYKIVDSDFVEAVDILLEGAALNYAITVGSFIAVIETYEKRNLNVGLNQLLCMSLLLMH